MNHTISQAYQAAKERYAQLGVDTDQALKTLAGIAISMHCWQGDDVRGFLFPDRELSGGIQATGGHPGAARNAEELRRDLDQAFSLIPGKHRVNLHAIYADTDEKVDLDALEPRHFAAWADWAAERGLGIDFNPTCFSHEKAESGFTLSSADPGIRAFWIEHCARCRRIGASFGARLKSRCVTNLWIPDGYKDLPADRLAPRARLMEALDEVYREPINPALNLDAVESKVFGIGSESYVTGSHEFYMGYALKNHLALTLDSGHFHPTETVSGKLSALCLFLPEMLLHVSRPVRWDSDHIVIFDDELQELARELVRCNLLGRVHIGLDYFDASVNRVAAWVIGMHNLQKALLCALLEPGEKLREAELSGDLTTRLALLEHGKAMPWQSVWEYFCEQNNVPAGLEWLDAAVQYEKSVLDARG